MAIKGTVMARLLGDAGGTVSLALATAIVLSSIASCSGIDLFYKFDSRTTQDNRKLSKPMPGRAG